MLYPKEIRLKKLNTVFQYLDLYVRLSAQMRVNMIVYLCTKYKV